MRARGFDCSEYNNVDWASVRPNDASFVIIRTSSGGGSLADPKNPQGKSYTDKSLASHYAGAGSIGALRGCYHLCLMSNPPEAEAEAWFAVAGQYDWELPPALDVEVVNELKTIPLADQITWITRCAVRAGTLFGRKPLLYSFRYQFSDQWARASNVDLLNACVDYWPADLTKGAPPAETAQPYQAPYLSTWKFWQCSGNVNGTTNPTPGSQVLPGFHGMAIDQDVFNGTVDDLRQFSADSRGYTGPDPSFAQTLQSKLTALGSTTPGTVAATSQSMVGPIMKAGLVVGAGALAYKYGPTVWDRMKARIGKVSL
jgi:GH25 family lysozyme M1 (1,4-beta-N-acetylmuramidase)